MPHPRFSGEEIVRRGEEWYERAIRAQVETEENIGKIVSIEKQIDAKDLPKAVADAIAEKYKDKKITKAEEITEGEKTFYEVLIDLGEKKSVEVKLEPTGKIVNEEKKEGKDKDE